MIATASSVPDSLNRWRAAARKSLTADLHPDELEWYDDGSVTRVFGDLIADPASGSGAANSAVNTRVPQHFISLARSVACHRDAIRWSLLYSLLWRVTHNEAHILEVASDPLVHRIIRMHRGVRRAAHKMKAFVRFRSIRNPDTGIEEFVAWFEPAHRVVERTAPFFVRRFPSMRWSILTPDGCARWDGETLQLGAGIEQHLAPTDEDSQDELWRTYYAAIFNPARLNRNAMRAEMPMRYWKNLPESALIASLTREAPGRVAAMIAQTLAAPAPMPADLEAIESAPRCQPPAMENGWHPLHDPGWRIARERAEAVTVNAATPLERRGNKIFFGVAGWTDPTLLADGVFYPPGASDPEPRLRYYASQLSMVEVDATYYAMPSEETARRWVERTPDNFCFDVKAHALMTGHPTSAERLPQWLKDDLPIRLQAARNVYAHHFSRDAITEVWSRFLSALAPLRDAGKLGAIMLQYPRWFTPTRESADKLGEAREHLGDCPASVELRHREWLTDRIAPRTFQLLRALSFSYVAVDAPPGMESSMPPTMQVTNPDLAIIRLHGRRVSTWEAKNDVVTERYRYLYDRTQLEAWQPIIERAVDEAMRVHLTFNNNHANYATTNAVEMHELLASTPRRSHQLQ